MDAYTIGLLYLVLYITNKIIELSLAAISVVAVAAGVVIAVIGRRKK